MPTRRVIERLEEQARKNFEVAKKAIDEKNRSQALSALEIAEQAWPTLPGLREIPGKNAGGILGATRGHASIACRLFSTDRHDRRRQLACRLIYETSVEARNAPSTTQGYYPVVTDMPSVLPEATSSVCPAI